MILMMKKVISVLLMVGLFVVLTGCNKTTYDNGSNIIEADQLKGLLSEKNTVVVDARSIEDYNKGHLVGAIHLSPYELTVSEPVAGTIASKNIVEKVLSEKGISNDSNVYIYDNDGGVSASRVWWVMKVYGHNVAKVINNGEAAIVQNKLELTLDTPEISSTEYVASDMNTSMIATFDDVVSVIDNKTKATIIDARSRAEFDEGAIPTAILYPHTKNLYSDDTFKSARDIYLDYHDLSLDLDNPIIVYCKSSFRAAQTTLLLTEAGFKDVRVYDGAWLEWSTKGIIEKQEYKVTPSAQDAS